MHFTLKPLALLLLGTLTMARAHGASLSLDIEIPAIETAEYHRPYVAVWLENKDRTLVRDLSVWYEQKKPNQEGTQWLKDLRRWWRVSGRNQNEPADGISGATRAVGKHTVNFGVDHPGLKDLPDGSYTVSVEAAREKGGYELVKLPLSWPVKEHGNTPETVKGERELGEVQLRVMP